MLPNGYDHQGTCAYSTGLARGQSRNERGQSHNEWIRSSPSQLTERGVERGIRVVAKGLVRCVSMSVWKKHQYYRWQEGEAGPPFRD